MLKLIACLTMLIDHIGYAFFPGMLWLRVIGRIAFPLFACYLAVGHRRTRSPWRYMGRMAGWAVLSQIPFALLFHGASLSDPVSFLKGTNVLFTFLLALLGLRLIEMTRARHWTLQATAWAGALGLAWFAEFIKTDYGFYGVACVLLFSVFDRWAHLLPVGEGREARPSIPIAKQALPRFLLMGSLFALTLAFVKWAHMHPVQLLCVAAIPLMWMNLPEPKPGKWKHVFYAFYPVHILIIWLATLALMS